MIGDIGDTYEYYLVGDDGCDDKDQQAAIISLFKSDFINYYNITCKQNNFSFHYYLMFQILIILLIRCLCNLITLF